MKYLVCKKQEGTGCDYTIGCGMTYEIIEAVSLEAATDMVIYPEDDEDSPCGVAGLSEALIVPIVNMIDIDIPNILKQHEEKQEKSKEHHADLAEFERLKKKLDK